MPDTYTLDLSYGIVSVYKLRNHSTYHNIKAPDNYNWGTVYQISLYEIYHTTLGDNVLFSGTDITCKLAVSSVTYYLLPEVKIVTKDINN